MFENDPKEIDSKQIFNLIIFIVLVLSVIYQIFVLFQPQDGDPATFFKKLICILWIFAGTSWAIKLLVDMQVKSS